MRRLRPTFTTEVLKTKLGYDDGYLIPSREPGLGIELNHEVIARHTPYTGDRLHLQMAREHADVKDFMPAKG